MGALDGVRVVEFAGLGPVPFAGLMLADMGAEVIRVDRPAAVDNAAARAVEAAIGLAPPDRQPLDRGRRSVAVNLKDPRGLALVRRLVGTADALVEGFRPGVMERLGLGPEACLGADPRLVYGRVTGWGRSGPLADRAGHDIDYLALSGVLGALGPAGGPPSPPLNLVGDFAGGGLLLAYGIVCALLERAASGRGQVVDQAMVDGAALLNVAAYGPPHEQLAPGGRGGNILDGGSHFYGCYETADGRYVAVGAIEEPFYEALVRVLGERNEGLAERLDPRRWPARKAAFARVFRQRTRSAWDEAFAGVDACFAPVLAPEEAPAHPHHRARDAFPAPPGGAASPAPTPRLGRTPGALPGPGPQPGRDTGDLLAGLGVTEAELAKLVAAGVVATADRP